MTSLTPHVQAMKDSQPLHPTPNGPWHNTLWKFVLSLPWELPKALLAILGCKELIAGE